MAGALIAALVAGGAAQAQPRRGGHPDTEGDLQLLFAATVVGQLNAVSPAAKAEGAWLRDQAEAERRAGRLGEMRRLLSQSIAVMDGRPWDTRAELEAALAVRPFPRVIDPQSGRLWVQLSQYFPLREQPKLIPSKARVVLARKAGGAPVASAESVVLSRDLIDTPLTLSLDLSAVPDGVYWLTASLGHEGTEVTRRTQVHVVRGLAAAQASAEARLAKLAVSASAQALVRYPFDLAKTMNEGRRQPLAYDFPAGIRKASEILDAAEQGRDLAWRGRGTQERAYWLAAANRYEAYRLYVPSRWTAGARLPLVVILHGSNGDRNSELGRNQTWQALAEQHGWILAAPDGYASNSLWGGDEPVVMADGTAPPPRPKTIDAVVQPSARHEPEPAEEVVLTVIEAVAGEYGVDRKRIYLTGNSMGGEGVWHLVAKYPDLFAAAAAGAAAPTVQSLERTGTPRTPLLVVHGEKDPVTSHDASVRMVEAVNRTGGRATMLSVKDGGHGALGQVLAQVFAFFTKHARP